MAKTKAKPKPPVKLPELLFSFNIMCCNKRHTVGLTTKGQLYLPAHTIKELERELNFRTMGGQPCKCADFLEDWRCGKFSFEVPYNCSIERRFDALHAGRLALVAKRIQRRAGKGRDDLRKHVQGRLEGKDPGNQMATLVSLEMARRGYENTVDGNSIRCDEAPEAQAYRTDEHKMIFKMHQNGYLQVAFGHYSTFSTIAESKFAIPPVRQLADMMETQLFVQRLTDAEDRNIKAQKVYLQERAAKLNDKYRSRFTKLSISEEAAHFHIEIELKHLTIHAAELILEAYSKVRGRIVRINNANGQRKDQPHRFPSKPGTKTK